MDQLPGAPAGARPASAPSGGARTGVALPALISAGAHLRAPRADVQQAAAGHPDRHVGRARLQPHPAGAPARPLGLPAALRLACLYEGARGAQGQGCWGSGSLSNNRVLQDLNGRRLRLFSPAAETLAS